MDLEPKQTYKEEKGLCCVFVFFLFFFQARCKICTEMEQISGPLLAFRLPSSWTALLSVFMQEIKWKTKVKKRESLPNSRLLTNECIIEESQLRISLIRARLGP